MEKEKEEEREKTHEEEWMVRPCMIYKDEYDDCTCINARFHQYYVFGKFLDCNQWKVDYDNCCQWKKHKSEEAYTDLIESEKQRRKNRMLPHYHNDVWERRQKPPEDWNAPLPEWLEKKYRNSYLSMRSQEMKGNDTISETLNSKCTIL